MAETKKRETTTYKKTSVTPKEDTQPARRRPENPAPAEVSASPEAQKQAGKAKGFEAKVNALLPDLYAFAAETGDVRWRQIAKLAERSLADPLHYRGSDA